MVMPAVANGIFNLQRAAFQTIPVQFIAVKSLMEIVVIFIILLFFDNEKWAA